MWQMVFQDKTYSREYNKLAIALPSWGLLSIEGSQTVKVLKTNV